MHHDFKTTGTCAQLISFDLEGDKVTNISFAGGCNGNLKAISKLVDGMSVSYINEKLAGNTCGFKNTSCADQLSKAVLAAYEEENKG